MFLFRTNRIRTNHWSSNRSRKPHELFTIGESVQSTFAIQGTVELPRAGAEIVGGAMV
jgi:hypothetical protein